MRERRVQRRGRRGESVSNGFEVKMQNRSCGPLIEKFKMDLEYRFSFSIFRAHMIYGLLVERFLLAVLMLVTKIAISSLHSFFMLSRS